MSERRRSANVVRYEARETVEQDGVPISRMARSTGTKPIAETFTKRRVKWGRGPRLTASDDLNSDCCDSDTVPPRWHFSASWEGRVRAAAGE
jgi:hypothetical protein